MGENVERKEVEGTHCHVPWSLSKVSRDEPSIQRLYTLILDRLHAGSKL